ncbi:hypothetical protein AJ87_21230 [Rhizobium yanglingense]|nr:hypothetical protein AJ87_21230 [Rhizobium yanglingense]
MFIAKITFLLMPKRKQQSLCMQHYVSTDIIVAPKKFRAQILPLPQPGSFSRKMSRRHNIVLKEIRAAEKRAS